MCKTPLQRAIEHQGSGAELARQLGIVRQAIYQWGRVPVEHVLNIEALTGVSRSDLRRDIYPPPYDAIPSDSEPAGE